jgi:hypothetical protein
LTPSIIARILVAVIVESAFDHGERIVDPTGDQVVACSYQRPFWALYQLVARATAFERTTERHRIVFMVSHRRFRLLR